MDNLVIDFIILAVTALVMKTKTGFFGKLLAGLFGALSALFLPLATLPAIPLVTVKLLVGVLMVGICFREKGFKKNLLIFLVFLTVTAAMGGMCFFILFLFGGNLQDILSGTYNLPIPMGVVFALLGGYVFLMIKVIKHFQRKKKLANFVFSVHFLNETKEIVAQAYLDSGNTLLDPETQKPVVIISYALFQKLFSVPFEKLLTKTVGEELKDSRYSPYGTVGQGKNQLLVFSIERMVIETENAKLEHTEAVLGLSFAKLQSSFGCDALLNPYLF